MRFALQFASFHVPFGLGTETTIKERTTVVGVAVFCCCFDVIAGIGTETSSEERVTVISVGAGGERSSSSDAATGLNLRNKQRGSEGQNHEFSLE